MEKEEFIETLKKEINIAKNNLLITKKGLDDFMLANIHMINTKNYQQYMHLIHFNAYNIGIYATLLDVMKLIGLPIDEKEVDEMFKIVTTYPDSNIKGDA